MRSFRAMSIAYRPAASTPISAMAPGRECGAPSRASAWGPPRTRTARNSTASWRITRRANNWRWCHKCQSLFFNGHPTKGKCPAGGAHESTGSGNYSSRNNWAAAPGQRQLALVPQVRRHVLRRQRHAGRLPSGGRRTTIRAAADYKLIFNAWGSPQKASDSPLGADLRHFILTEMAGMRRRQRPMMVPAAGTPAWCTRRRRGIP